MAQEKAKSLALIEILRQKISSILMTALNVHWKDAAFRRSHLDRDRLTFLVQTLHESDYK